MVEFVPVTQGDIPEILEIFNYYIQNSTATFHSGRMSREELEGFLFISHPRYPSFLITEGGEIVGYCFLTQYKKRQAYDRTAELSIYLKPEYTGNGIGPIALEFLESAALSAGLHVLVATLCGENFPSIRLMEKGGYTRCAHMKHIGEKFGRILDVVIYQKEI